MSGCWSGDQILDSTLQCVVVSIVEQVLRYACNKTIACQMMSKRSINERRPAGAVR